MEPEGFWDERTAAIAPVVYMSLEDKSF